MTNTDVVAENYEEHYVEGDDGTHQASGSIKRSYAEHRRKYWLEPGKDGKTRRKPAPRVWARKGNEHLFGEFCLNLAKYGSISRACANTVVPDTTLKEAKRLGVDVSELRDDQLKYLPTATVYNVRNKRSVSYSKEMTEAMDAALQQFNASVADVARGRLKEILMKDMEKDSDLIALARLALETVKTVDSGKLNKEVIEESNIVEAHVITADDPEENQIYEALEDISDFDELEVSDVDALLPTK